MTIPTASTIEQERAFPAYACADRYFASRSAEEARRSVDQCVRRGDGPALLIGAPGMGKTMLLEVLSAGFADRFGMVSLTSSQVCTRRALLQAVLFGLDLPFRERDEGELRLSLMQALQDRQELPNGIVLLVDEAQLLAPRLLEELRVLSNLTLRGEPIVRLVLLGGPGLEETFADPELEAFNQRVGTRCYVNSLTYEETREYVRAHVAAVGADPEAIFTPDGLDAVFHASDGVPRLINQICDRALRAAVAESLEQVDAQVVQQAWSDLHQLPAPWETRKPAAPAPQTPVSVDAPGVVEFGELADLTDAEPEVHPPVVSVEVDLAGPPSAARQSVWNADQALGVTTPIEQAIRASEPAEADDPFGEEFQEEEIVIDRFSGLEVVFQSTTPVVTNTLDPKLSTMASTLARSDSYEPDEAPADESFDELLEQDVEAPKAQKPPALRLQPEELELLSDDDDADDPRLSTLSIDARADATADDSDILIIENDLIEVEGVKQPMARRQEYRQLFAKLRHG
ncbi:hypothetical protein KOR34_31100 [Posidoniimonas corsicana]|uniref:AAA+ ATPase domain-containing protein n=1 Tax=Posidoniimonas corsicana TaxID=1938618 RepID=A0A5C5VKA7_9BACT|nr:AAA family ATPase [Posidoniimonas corsicana]TWT38142.1 hypothetical protein KOR34_31100 [Posidoniimonas corsicana]